jgi:hypothetical protein
MLLKLAALGAIGYAGYKFYENNKDSFRMRSNSRSPGVRSAARRMCKARRTSPTADQASAKPEKSVSAASRSPRHTLRACTVS